MLWTKNIITLASLLLIPALAEAAEVGWICQGDSSFLERFDGATENVTVVVIDDDDCRGAVSDIGWIELDLIRRWAQLDFEIELNLDQLQLEQNAEIHVFELRREVNLPEVVRLSIRQQQMRRFLLASWSDDLGNGGQYQLVNLLPGDRRIRVSWIENRTQNDGGLRFAVDGQQVLALNGLQMSSFSRPRMAILGLLASEQPVDGTLLFRPLSESWSLVPPGSVSGVDDP